MTGAYPVYLPILRQQQFRKRVWEFVAEAVPKPWLIQVGTGGSTSGK